MSKSKRQKIEEKINQLIDFKQSKTDPQGSYTGVAKDKFDEVIQDADDL